MSPFVQDLSTQEELESHPSDVLLLIFGRPWWILSVLDEALDIVIPRLVDIVIPPTHSMPEYLESRSAMVAHHPLLLA